MPREPSTATPPSRSSRTRFPARGERTHLRPGARVPDGERGRRQRDEVRPLEHGAHEAPHRRETLHDSASRVEEYERPVRVPDEDRLPVCPDGLEHARATTYDAAADAVQRLVVELLREAGRARARVARSGGVALRPRGECQQAPVPDERAGPVAGRIAGRAAAVLHVRHVTRLRSRERGLADDQLEVVAAVRLLPRDRLAPERQLGNRVEPGPVVVALRDRRDRFRRAPDPPEYDRGAPALAVAGHDGCDDVAVRAHDRRSRRQRDVGRCAGRRRGRARRRGR